MKKHKDKERKEERKEKQNQTIYSTSVAVLVHFYN